MRRNIISEILGEDTRSDFEKLPGRIQKAILSNLDEEDTYLLDNRSDDNNLDNSYDLRCDY
ncbi:MAG: hypothetical protein AB1403_10825 [Candidatus Riflebacteria bacterium]